MNSDLTRTSLEVLKSSLEAFTFSSFFNKRWPTCLTCSIFTWSGTARAPGTPLGLAQGHNDLAELTSRGLRQAAETAARFSGHPVRALYASDLRRALQTAAAFAGVLGLPVFADGRLRERSLGVLEGTAAMAIDPALTGLAGGRVTDPDARPAGGESVRDLYQRAAGFAEELAAASRRRRRRPARRRGGRRARRHAARA